MVLQKPCPIISIRQRKCPSNPNSSSGVYIVPWRNQNVCRKISIWGSHLKQFIPFRDASVPSISLLRFTVILFYTGFSYIISTYSLPMLFLVPPWLLPIPLYWNYSWLSSKWLTFAILSHLLKKYMIIEDNGAIDRIFGVKSFLANLVFSFAMLATTQGRLPFSFTRRVYHV